MVSDKKPDFARQFFSTGVEAYKEQCAHGGVELKKAGALTDRRVFVFPPTPRDQAAYGTAETSADFNARVIVARLRTEDNRPVFARGPDIEAAVRLLTGPLMNVKDVMALAEEIMAAYGEIKLEDLEENADPDADEPVGYAMSEEHHTPTVDGALGN